MILTIILILISILNLKPNPYLNPNSYPNPISNSLKIVTGYQIVTRMILEADHPLQVHKSSLQGTNLTSTLQLSLFSLTHWET
jgi:hypothetical protein